MNDRPAAIRPERTLRRRPGVSRAIEDPVLAHLSAWLAHVTAEAIEASQSSGKSESNEMRLGAAGGSGEVWPRTSS